MKLKKTALVPYKDAAMELFEMGATLISDGVPLT